MGTCVFDKILVVRTGCSFNDNYEAAHDSGITREGSGKGNIERAMDDAYCTFKWLVQPFRCFPLAQQM